MLSNPSVSCMLYILTTRPYVNVTTAMESQVWICFSFDCATMMLMMVDMLSLGAVCMVVNHYWNANFDITNQVSVVVVLLCIITGLQTQALRAFSGDLVNRAQ